MIRKNQEFINGVNIILDMMVVIFSYVFASWLRLEYFNGQSTNMAAISAKTILLAAGYSIILIFLLSLFEFYNTTRTKRLLWKAKTIFVCVTISTLLATAFLFIFRLVEFSRGVLLAFYFITLFVLIAKYTFMRLVLRRFRGKGFNLKHIIVIGTGELARQFKRNVEREPELGYKIKGFVGTPTALLDDNEYLGGLEDLDQIIASPEISEAIIAVGAEDSSRIRKIISVCERNGVRYSVIPFYNDIIPANPVIEMVGDSKLIMMRSNRLENIGWAILKRSFDLLGSLFGLIFLFPLFIVIAIGVKCSSPGPVFFKQVRVGYQRREFKMLKFRSLKVNDQEDTAWSTDTDPRRTKFGTFIRKTSLDELPQLINVLKGEMSLIGPRPELPHFVDQFKETIPFYMVKHQVKPGMTGWAQVNGYRGDTSIQKRIELDLWYIENWSPGLDLHIMVKTFFGGLINSEKLDN